MITVPAPPAPSLPPHPARSETMPNAMHAPRLTECNLIGLRRETANIIPLTAPRPLRTRESRAMRRGEPARFFGVERGGLALRPGERGAQCDAHLTVRRGTTEAIAQGCRGERRRERLHRELRNSRLVVLEENRPMLEQRT